VSVFSVLPLRLLYGALGLAPPFHLHLPPRLGLTPWSFAGLHDVLVSVSAPVEPRSARLSRFYLLHQQGASAHHSSPFFSPFFSSFAVPSRRNTAGICEYDNGYGKPPPSAGQLQGSEASRGLAPIPSTRNPMVRIYDFICTILTYSVQLNPL
jgi:hypothetical protein